MMMRYLCAAIILFTTISGYSQRRHYDFWNGSSTAIRLNLTSLMDPIETNFSVGAEHQLNKRWGVGLDAGYIFYSNYYEKSKQSSGIILRPAARYYLNENGKGYVEAELHYKNCRYKIADWLQKDIVNGVATYEQFQTFTLAKNVYGANIKLGTKARLSRNERLWMEFYFGMGLRYKKQRVIHEPNSNYIPLSTFRLLIDDGNRALFSMPAGIRLLLKL